MRQFGCAVLERHTTFSQTFETEPYETAWASEAIFFVRVEAIAGSAIAIDARVQISPDGVRWIDEGTLLPTITEPGNYFVRVSHFGGWLRLTGTAGGEVPEFSGTIHLVLKE